MATTIEYALMAGASYISTRADINKFPIPQGWTSVIDPPHIKDDVTGFEAIAFTNGSEIVISFAGTVQGSDWFHGNIPLAMESKGSCSNNFPRAIYSGIANKAAHPLH